ncbi:flavodoxin family protein [Cupriavidus sp. SW-Y-13]|uniref:flavodoxin family protein n=1 Tax=Cupriavidus sp. SW-Y-13 TaxID=2653854 RepID=UPI001365F4C4|nr:flavodoxin family protein [Cupriavidus sp. SW-Y-13]MWL89881.1 NADPH-dependent FMN reductase [Cupriavidus sp. SW-Y-13]
MTPTKPQVAAAAHDIRKGQVTEKCSREVFRKRFRARFGDPAFRTEDAAIDRLEEIAWQAYCDSRKAPMTTRAGAGAADPAYEIAVEWIDTRNAIERAQREHDDAKAPSRVLLIVAASRNDFTCPGEMSKSWRMAQLALTRMEGLGMQVDTLDLSRLTSEPDLNIHPCKGCVSTAMPLCHWPCSCYPNHSLGQVNDWMNEIYPRWVAAHGVMIVTPTYWYQATSPLKLMMDRLVCADGGNPDPSSTHGKTVAEAKQLELDGWDYPKHLDGRVFGLVVHGDVAGIEGVRRSLGDWLQWMGLIEAGAPSQLDRYIGYYEPYATSHRTLDADTHVQREVENVAAAVAQAVVLRRNGKLPEVGDALKRPRPK